MRQAPEDDPEVPMPLTLLGNARDEGLESLSDQAKIT
jgi:hypothetical protein